MYEQTNSEDKQGKISQVDRKSIARYISYRWESDKTKEETLKKVETRNRELGQNPGMIIKEGSTDRLSGVPYNDNKYDEVTKQNAYREGFFNHGNQEILGKLETLTEADLEDIGYNDCISGVEYQTLPNRVSLNPNYIAGYMKASLTQNKGKSK